MEVDEGDQYDSDVEGSRPIREVWPEDSELTPDHFTIDTQTCLACGKNLGYAMPMNKKPNPKFLFCLDEDGNDLCRGKVSYVTCHYCGNFNNESSGSLVSRPGNSGYCGPSSIYSFMCHYCYDEMKKGEPGLEECRTQMAKVREVRRAEEMKERGLSFLDCSGGSFGQQTPQEVYSSFFDSSIITPARKRKLNGPREEKEEACET
jgi:hypothetical protein